MTTTKRTPAKKKGGGDKTSEELVGIALCLIVGYLALTWTSRAVSTWWTETAVPWLDEWRPWLITAAVIIATATLAAGFFWVRARWRDRTRRAAQKRVEKRHPEEQIPAKPKVTAVDEQGRAAEIVVPMPSGKATTDRTAAEVADHHGRSEFGAPANYTVRVNPKTGVDEVVLTSPLGPPRDLMERDLAVLARETLPQVSDVHITGRDPATGAPLQVAVHYEVTAKVFSPTVIETMERVLAAKLGWEDPNGYRMTWDHVENVATLEQCDDPLARVIPYPFGQVNDIIDRDTKMLYFGVAGENGRELQGWDLDQRPHTLISGETGFGKSDALGVFLFQALLMGWRVVLLVPKKRTFRYLDGLPNVERYGDAKGLDSARQMAAAIQAVHDLMEGRHDLDDDGLDKEQRVLFIVDELYELYAALNRLWLSEEDENGKPNRGEHPALTLLNGLASLARESMIHLLFAIQRPDTSVMGAKAAGFMRAQLGNRIALGPMDPDGAQMMFGRGNPAVRAATRLPIVQGRCLAPLPNRAPGYRPGQVWWLNLKDATVREKVRDMVLAAHPEPTVPLVHLAPTEPAPDDEGEGDESPTVDMAKPPARPVKKRAAKRAPRPAPQGEPVVVSRDDVHADQLQRGDWTRVLDDDGNPMNVRVATVVVDEDAETVTIGGFGWGKRTLGLLDNMPVLHFAEDPPDDDLDEDGE